MKPENDLNDVLKELQDIYEAIALERPNTSERDFSKDWCQRSESWFGWSKSTNHTPTLESIALLHGKILHEREVVKHRLDQSTTVVEKRFLEDWTRFFNDLGNRTYQLLVKQSRPK